ncbi:hypothetical protein [Antarcticimicrobium luteum]|uniref:Uncharacterized protein n=1 Tax=Antarcticimicrobium luteum TaxID=2547397 RepID=A0A4R5V0V2_9RHOB|nr:hypothetical protein [Antarcticimicrobium luteum]TDK45036.1 hypothetical protein E1832_14270 [Antarcticimicrobium luteum]
MPFRSILRRAAAPVLGAALIALAPTLPARAATESCAAPLTREIPNRTARAPSGSALMEQLMAASGPARDQAIVDQVLSGNLPSFLRHLTPVTLAGKLASGAQVLITICVTPDYLSVGDDRDFVRVPMGLAGAARVASELGFLLPTPKMVDAIYSQAKVHVAPSPMTPGSKMASTAYLLQHDRTVDQQRARVSRDAGALTAGQKKDIVLTNRLLSKPGRVAIYGWHRINGRPIQPLSTVHGASYADYSHGVRLVSRTAFLNGKQVPLSDIMQDRDLALIVNGEGPIGNAERLLASLY